MGTSEANLNTNDGRENLHHWRHNRKKRERERDALFKENVNLNNCGHKIATKSGIL